ncbi:hypothetical protein KSP40_PGU003108 [Platanthera guangdongensis]|uniref:Uncharacterized protein n=1 Tax=Platanthera guangdongensis TaxID=2320717 RepID=A0ABR2N0H2_9ASPA
MPGWIPRRLGGGLGGKKESGQLRFGGRERPFRAPLRPIPYDDLKRLGIPPPPEGRFLSRFQVPSPPRSGRRTKKGDSPSQFGDDDDDDDMKAALSRRNGRAATSREDSKPRYRRSDDDEISTDSREGTHSRLRISDKREEAETKQKSRRTVRDEWSSRRRRSPEVDDDSETRRRRRKRSPLGGAETAHKLRDKDRLHGQRK